jgi:hypothetical protein
LSPELRRWTDTLLDPEVWEHSSDYKPPPASSTAAFNLPVPASEIATAAAPVVTFAGHLADAQTSITSAGFVAELWSPSWGWDATETEAAEDPFDPQLLAAFQCFLAFFCRSVQRVWVHLAAEMQAGKTGVVTALIRLILSNGARLGIGPTRIFILTGMNDNAWKKQTRDRLPAGIRANVYHNGSLNKFPKALQSLKGSGDLRNVLIVLDESHIASAKNNRPQREIYNAVNSLCPQEKWQENNIRFLTISATDPAKVLVMRGAETAQVVRLQTTDAYQSVETLAIAGRVRWLEAHGDLHEDKGITELHRCITTEFSDAPRYHILRARYGKQEAAIARIRAAFPDCIVQKYDSDEKLMSRSSAADDASTALSEIEDINELLSEPPAQHTFIVLKNMFYAAKTLNDEYVGVLWDRLGGKDDTNLQSLLGRACGYGKSDRTVVYAARSTVDNYIRFWRELCSHTDAATVVTGIPVSKVTRKMPGVVARRAAGGASLSAAASVSAPLAAVGGAGTADAAAGASSARKVANEDDFTHTFTEFATLEEARFRYMHTPAMDSDGFYLTSTTTSAEKQSYAAVLAICTGKKTANLPWGSLDVGKSVNRLYVAYRDMADPTSAVFVRRTLTRIR